MMSGYVELTIRFAPKSIDDGSVTFLVTKWGSQVARMAYRYAREQGCSPMIAREATIGRLVYMYGVPATVKV